MTKSSFAVSPESIRISVNERRTLSFDTAPDLLPSADTAPSAIVATLVTTNDDALPVSVAIPPTVRGTSVLQVIDGLADNLVVYTVYRLRIQFTALPSNNKFVMDLELDVWP